MPVFRLIIFCFLGLIAAKSSAQTTIPAPTEENTSPTRAPEPRITFTWVHVDGPYIALTFDDGPNPKLTPKLLDLLAAHHIRATFFVIGQNVAEHPEVVARAVREGHEIGNHSWSHPKFGRMSDEAVRREVQRTEDAIKNACGVRPVLLRPPYGSITPHEKQWLHDQLGYQIILWDVDPLDWQRPGPTVVCNRIVKETRPGSIVLSHDIHPGTIEAMPAILNQLEARGFKFVTVSELIGLATPEAPKPLPVRHAEAPPAPPATPASPGGRGAEGSSASPPPILPSG